MGTRVDVRSINLKPCNKNKNLCFSSHIFHKYFVNQFFKLGFHIAKNPSYYIIIPTFLSLLGITGIQRVNYEKDPEYLFTPSNGIGKMNRDEIEQLFPVDYENNFDPSRMTRVSHFARLIITAKDNDTMLRVNVWNDLISLDETIRNISIEHEGRHYTFEEVCAKRNGKCIENLIFNLNDYIPRIENKTFWLNYPITLHPFVVPFYFGGSVINETEGVLESVKGIALHYFLREDDEYRKKVSYIWEGKLLEYLNSAKFEYIDVARFALRSLEDEINKNVEVVTPYLTFTIILMVIFSVLCVFSTDWVRSKLSIGILGVVSTIMATGCGFGILMYCGVPFTGANMAAPFLMLGIGIDDMFVILCAWQRTKIQDDVPSRMGKTYMEAAVSVTITSLTNMLSFFIGAWNPFPSVQFFCLYTGIAIFITYLWFITFFGAILALSGYKEQRQKHSITGKVVVSKSEAEEKGMCYKFWCSGGINENDPWNPKDNKDNSIMIFFRDYYGKSLTIPMVKVVVIIIYIAYICGAIYGCLRVKEGLKRQDLVTDNSYVIKFLEMDDKLFRKYPYRIQVIIHDNLTYSDSETKKALLKMHDQFEKLPYIGSRIFTQSWIRGFYRFLKKRPRLRANITDEKSFIDVLRKEYLEPSSDESLDVVFNEDKSRILASRLILQTFMINDTCHEAEMVQALRKVSDESPFHVIVYQFYFVFFDQFLIVRKTCIQTICLAAFLMMVVSLTFIPNPLTSLWVAFSIISIEVGVFGYMTFWGVSLDSISMINLIMCVGFSVDFSAHISYAYLTAKAVDSKDKIQESLYKLGLPIMQGGLSTILGVLVLSFSPSYVFQTFFKIVFMVTVFGTVHGVLLLPVMFSFMGRLSCSKSEKKQNFAERFQDAKKITPNMNGKTDSHKSSPRLIKVIKDYNDKLETDLGISSLVSSTRSSFVESDSSLSAISDTGSNRHSQSSKL